MDKQQARALLRELVASRLIEPTWISIEKCKQDTYKLKVKAVQKTEALERFLASNNLAVEEQNGYWLISNP